MPNAGTSVATPTTIQKIADRLTAGAERVIFVLEEVAIAITRRKWGMKNKECEHFLILHSIFAIMFLNTTQKFLIIRKTYCVRRNVLDQRDYVFTFYVLPVSKGQALLRSTYLIQNRVFYIIHFI